MLKNDQKKTAEFTWQPTASLENLCTRALILKSIREFFSARGVLEVETPLLCYTSVTDACTQSIPALIQTHPSVEQKRYYLQTSPEYAMKRLLAANSGPIYQMSKAFRQGEVGRFHNPEFTMLEWYRPGFDHHDLMNEVDELLQAILNVESADRKSYAELFQEYLQINPHTATFEELMQCAQANHVAVVGIIHDRDIWLDLLLSHCIEPKLGFKRPCFIYDFPASQAALARIQPTTPPLASRFEVYVNGIELANGFHELQDAVEQRSRFESDLAERATLGLQPMPIDELFLSALEQGLPDCAGVAVGVDRLVMIATESGSISDVVSFDFSHV